MSRTINAKVGCIIFSDRYGIEVLIGIDEDSIMGNGIWYKTESFEYAGRGDTKMAIDDEGRIINYVNNDSDEYYLVAE